MTPAQHRHSTQHTAHSTQHTAHITHHTPRTHHAHITHTSRTHHAHINVSQRLSMQHNTGTLRRSCRTENVWGLAPRNSGESKSSPSQRKNTRCRSSGGDGAATASGGSNRTAPPIEVTVETEHTVTAQSQHSHRHHQSARNIERHNVRSRAGARKRQDWRQLEDAIGVIQHQSSIQQTKNS